MKTPINKDSLIQKIELAFCDVEHPGDDNLVNSSYGEEPEEVKRHFLGQSDWKKLSPDFLDFDGALSFFSDKAFRFYLPAFLIADLNEKLEFNDPTNRLCWALTPQSENTKIAKAFGGETLGEKARKCFDVFSKEQVGVIVSYLQFRLAKDDYNPTIQQALEHYWLNRVKI